MKYKNDTYIKIQGTPSMYL